MSASLSPHPYAKPRSTNRYEQGCVRLVPPYGQMPHFCGQQSDHPIHQETAMTDEPTACGAKHPTNSSMVPCMNDAGHGGKHFSTTGCAGSAVCWDTRGTITAHRCHDWCGDCDDTCPCYPTPSPPVSLSPTPKVGERWRVTEQDKQTGVTHTHEGVIAEIDREWVKFGRSPSWTFAILLCDDRFAWERLAEAPPDWREGDVLWFAPAGEPAGAFTVGGDGLVRRPTRPGNGVQVVPASSVPSSAVLVAREGRLVSGSGE